LGNTPSKETATTLSKQYSFECKTLHFSDTTNRELFNNYHELHLPTR